MISKLIQRCRGVWLKNPTPLLMRENPLYAPFEIGEWSYGRPQITQFDNSTRLRIGRFCSIADGVKILLGGEHRTDWVTTYPFTSILPSKFRAIGHPSSKGDISIGNDVWICTSSIILSGVTICNGAVIGAGSVISQNVPPYAIAVGNPAKIVRFRFNPEIIEKLELLAWWNWPMNKIEKMSPLLLSNQVEEFLAKATES